MRLHAARRAPGWVLVLVTLAASGCEVGVEQPAETSIADSSEVQEPPPAMTPVAPQQRGRIARGKLNFVDGYRAGCAQAAREGKPMLLFFTAQWCHYCHQMAEESFTHPQVVAMAQRFVCVLIDADVEGNVCRQFQVTGYPTIQLLSPRGTPLVRLVGKKPGHQLIMAMQSALQSTARHDESAEALLR